MINVYQRLDLILLIIRMFYFIFFMLFIIIILQLSTPERLEYGITGNRYNKTIELN